MGFVPLHNREKKRWRQGETEVIVSILPARPPVS